MILKLHASYCVLVLKEPRLRCQTENRYVQTEMNAQGGVVRSKLHGLEKNERTIVWTYAILNAR